MRYLNYSIVNVERSELIDKRLKVDRFDRYREYYGINSYLKPLYTLNVDVGPLGLAVVVGSSLVSVFVLV